RRGLHSLQRSSATRSEGAMSAALVIRFRSRDTTTSAPSRFSPRKLASFIEPSPSSAASGGEDLVEEITHRLPGALIRLFVIGGGQARGRQVPIGEGMDRAAIGDELPIDLRLLHL